MAAQDKISPPAWTKQRARKLLARGLIVVGVAFCSGIAAVALDLSDLRPVAGSLVLLVVGCGIVGLGLTLLGLLGLFWLPYKYGHCRHCGYNLTGLSEPRCPECGKEFDGEGRRV